MHAAGDQSHFFRSEAGLFTGEQAADGVELAGQFQHCGRHGALRRLAPQLAGNGLDQSQETGFHAGKNITLTANTVLQRRNMGPCHFFHRTEIPAAWGHAGQFAVVDHADHL